MTSTRTYPRQLEIQPLAREPRAVVNVPGSKSITNRAMVLAALSEGGTNLIGALRSEDTEVMIGALKQLGFDVDAKWSKNIVHICRPVSAAVIPSPSADLFVANSGTSMRFLTAMVALGKGEYRLDGVARMRQRPIGDLIAALRQLKVDVHSENGDGCPPILVRAAGIAGGDVVMKGDTSSQFLSGLLMVAPLAQAPITITIEGPLVSKPYVAMTMEMMRHFGASVDCSSLTWFQIGNSSYRCSEYAIEPDASAASYFFAAAAICGGRITVEGLQRSLQGDVRFVDVLEQMGAQVLRNDAGITVQGRSLKGIEVDMNDISDCVMTLAAAACFADGPTTIRNVAHIRYKETDRLAALAKELRKVGAGVDELPDGLRIRPGKLHGATIDTYNDHRMAMSLALVGLKVPGIVINDPGCVVKTYPGFFRRLGRTLSAVKTGERQAILRLLFRRCCRGATIATPRR
ncbi:MAG: 3-phosphoshikimate 1-carboxyvinyltransferase [Gemmatales bacterium]|nr:MAG: 3-phosphoshikimate 1-carboxyvinyltransferase [Gemmatales bacterium]